MTHNQSNKLSGIIDKLNVAYTELDNFLWESLEPQERMFVEEGYDKLRDVISNLRILMEE